MRKINLFMSIALVDVLASAVFTILEPVSVDNLDCRSVFLCDQNEIMYDTRG